MKLTKIKAEIVWNLFVRFVKSYPYRYAGLTIIQHPLVTSTTIIHPKTRDFIQVTKENFDSIVNNKLQYIKVEFGTKRDVDFLLALTNKPYRIPLLRLMTKYLTQKQYCTSLMWVWVSDEFVMQNGTRMLVEMFNRTKPKYLMYKKEKQVYDNLPDKDIVVYRGTQSTSALVKGLSWTLSKDVAVWFKNRFAFGGTLYKAKIDKENVYAYNNDREEKEIILNPYKLKDIFIMEETK
jgi:hypothetical protein